MKKSFTLIEVLVAMGVFMVGVAPLVGVVAASTRNFQASVQKSSMAQFAKEKLLEYQALTTMPTDTLVGSSTSHKGPGSAHDGFPSLHYREQYAAVSNDSFQVILYVAPKKVPLFNYTSDGSSVTVDLNHPKIYKFVYLHVVD